MKCKFKLKCERCYCVTEFKTMAQKAGNPLPEYVVCQNCGCLLTDQGYKALSKAIAAMRAYPETGTGFTLSVKSRPPSGGWAHDPEIPDDWE